jgi:hypothetical protein
MIEKGMGRARLTRFAAITIPAVAVTAGLGVAIVQGAVSADLASSQGFEVGSSSATATSLQLGLEDAVAASSDSATTTADNAAAEAALQGTVLDGMCLAANTAIPALTNVGVTISVADQASGGQPVNLGALSLNASSISADTANLPSTTVGRATSQEADLVNSKTEAPGGFAMDSSGGTVSLTNLDAKAYELTLNDGLDLNGLTITPSTTTATCG